MATPIKSLFPPIEKKPFLLNKQQKSRSRRPMSCIDTSLLSKILAVWWIQEAGLAHGSVHEKFSKVLATDDNSSKALNFRYS
jgi:hypothetical protein